MGRVAQRDCHHDAAQGWRRDEAVARKGAAAGDAEFHPVQSGCQRLGAERDRGFAVRAASEARQ